MFISEKSLRSIIVKLLIENNKSSKDRAAEYVRKYLGPEYLYLLTQPAFISAFDLGLNPIEVPAHIRHTKREERMEDAKESDRIKKGRDKIDKLRDVNIYNVDINQNNIDDDLRIPTDSSYIDK